MESRRSLGSNWTEDGRCLCVWDVRGKGVCVYLLYIGVWRIEWGI